MNKKVFIPIIAASVITASLVGVQKAYAQNANSSSRNRSMTQRIAQHFGINEEELQTYMEEARTEMQAAKQAEMQQNLQNKLAEAVNDGKITQAQSDALYAKMQEHRKSMESKRNAGERPSIEERENHRSEMESWLESQGISTEVFETLRPEGNGQRAGHGFKEGFLQ